MGLEPIAMNRGLDAERIGVALLQRGATLGQPLTVLQEVDSTNDEAKAAGRRGEAHGSLFVADSQRSGRGRGGKRWHSPPGENLYLSFLLRPTIEPGRMPMISLVAGVAIARVLEEALGPISPAAQVGATVSGDSPRVQIKWPNDVYVNDAKIAGVLIEAVTRGSAPPDVIVGIGLNVATRHFPPEIKHPPTSLALLGGEDVDRESLIAAIAFHLGEGLSVFAADGPTTMLAELERRDWLVGRTVQVGEIAGLAVGIDGQGQLEVRDRMGAVHSVVSEEVSVSAPPGRSS
jgi:BirA family biotin operon repressor/biotin-[acetyl-CoA-carboxylase] ligase